MNSVSFLLLIWGDHIVPTLEERLTKLASVSLSSFPPQVEGKVTRMVGLTMEAVGCVVALGDRCSVQVRQDRWVESEVVGFTGDLTYLMPTEAIEGICPGARVRPLFGESEMPVGDELLGRSKQKTLCPCTETLLIHCNVNPYQSHWMWVSKPLIVC